ncbi:WD40 repeat-like protein [Amylostereum chailletii]|nr:WD40 repeat-like protein [Amylostereum chailletii]
MSTTNDQALDPSAVPIEYLKEGPDWLAVFNPRVQRVMDVKLLARFPHDKVVCSVRLSPDASRVAVGYDGGVNVYDLEGGLKTSMPFTYADEPPARNYVRSVAFSPDGALLAAGSEDNQIRIWTLPSAEPLHTLAAHRREVYALDFAPDGTLVSGSGDRSLRLWSLSPTSPSPADPDSTVLAVEEDRAKPDTGITALAVSPDGAHVAAGALDGSIRVWKREGGTALVRWAAHAKTVYGLRWVGKALVSGSLDRTVKRWEVDLEDGSEGGRCVRTMEHKDYVLATATVQYGLMQRAASATRDGRLVLWDLKTGEALFLVMGHRNSVTSVDLNSSLVVSGSGDGEVRVWNYSVV